MLSRCALPCVALVLLFAQTALADPIISIRGGVGSNSFTGTLGITFTAAGGATCNNFNENGSVCTLLTPIFMNATGADITNFGFFFNMPQPPPFTTDSFSMFQVVTTLSNSAVILSGGTIPPFVGGNNNNGLSNNNINGVNNSVGEFAISFEGVVEGSQLTVISNVPEPATGLLLLIGFGAMVARRKRLSRLRS